MTDNAGDDAIDLDAIFLDRPVLDDKKKSKGKKAPSVDPLVTTMSEDEEEELAEVCDETEQLKKLDGYTPIENTPFPVPQEIAEGENYKGKRRLGITLNRGGERYKIVVPSAENVPVQDDQKNWQANAELKHNMFAIRENAPISLKSYMPIVCKAGGSYQPLNEKHFPTVFSHIETMVKKAIESGEPLPVGRDGMWPVYFKKKGTAEDELLAKKASRDTLRYHAMEIPIGPESLWTKWYDYYEKAMEKKKRAAAASTAPAPAAQSQRETQKLQKQVAGIWTGDKKEYVSNGAKKAATAMDMSDDEDEEDDEDYESGEESEEEEEQQQQSDDEEKEEELASEEEEEEEEERGDGRNQIEISKDFNAFTKKYKAPAAEEIKPPRRTKTVVMKKPAASKPVKESKPAKPAKESSKPAASAKASKRKKSDSTKKRPEPEDVSMEEEEEEEETEEEEPKSKKKKKEEKEPEGYGPIKQKRWTTIVMPYCRERSAKFRGKHSGKAMPDPISCVNSIEQLRHPKTEEEKNVVTILDCFACTLDNYAPDSSSWNPRPKPKPKSKSKSNNAGKAKDTKSNPFQMNLDD